MRRWMWGAMCLCVGMGATWWLGRDAQPVAVLQDGGPAALPDAQLLALLEGEQLAPPAALPPEVFVYDGAAAWIPSQRVWADRRWDRLDPAFVQRLLRVWQTMKQRHGLDMVLLEGWRSPERQDQLAAQGPQVSGASAWQSYHQHGLAADCAFWRDGRVHFSEQDPWTRQAYALLGEVSEQWGLTWGGRWAMRDLGHVEWHKPGVVLAPPVAPPVAHLSSRPAEGVGSR